MDAALLFAGLVAVGVAMHGTLYGRRRAPVGSVELTRRQWGAVAAFAAGPVLAVVALLSSAALRRAIELRSGERAPAVVVLFCFLSLVAIAWGMAPSYREADADGPDLDRTA